MRTQVNRIKLIANSSRLLILPEARYPNVCSRVLGLVERRVASVWRQRLGYRLLPLESFADPRRFHGGVYRAANWLDSGLTSGFRRTWVVTATSPTARSGCSCGAVVLALVAGASLCGMRGYKAMAGWAASLRQAARWRFGCRRENGRYVVPSTFVIGDCLVRVGPDALGRALRACNAAHLDPNAPLALDGKAMKGAVDEAGVQTHVVSLVGHT